ncbi:MAG: hypothetical protein JW730_18360 [Anaerolineales bacterium]|nr:hypothetical protein [Anaerolineales bacterium]
MYRQGDVMLIPAEVPEEAVEQKTMGRIILAEGEATGHAHSMLPAYAVMLATPDGRRFIRALMGATLEHQEHAAIAVPPGNYEIRIQREYEPEGVRNVAD